MDVQSGSSMFKYSIQGPVPLPPGRSEGSCSDAPFPSTNLPHCVVNVNETIPMRPPIIATRYVSTRDVRRSLQALRGAIRGMTGGSYNDRFEMQTAPRTFAAPKLMTGERLQQRLSNASTQRFWELGGAHPLGGSDGEVLISTPAAVDDLSMEARQTGWRHPVATLSLPDDPYADMRMRYFGNHIGLPSIAIRFGVVPPHEEPGTPSQGPTGFGEVPPHEGPATPPRQRPRGEGHNNPHYFAAHLRPILSTVDLVPSHARCYAGPFPVVPPADLFLHRGNGGDAPCIVWIRPHAIAPHFYDDSRPLTGPMSVASFTLTDAPSPSNWEVTTAAARLGVTPLFTGFVDASHPIEPAQGDGAPNEEDEPAFRLHNSPNRSQWSISDRRPHLSMRAFESVSLDDAPSSDLLWCGETIEQYWFRQSASGEFIQRVIIPWYDATPPSVVTSASPPTSDCSANTWCVPQRRGDPLTILNESPERNAARCPIEDSPTSSAMCKQLSELLLAQQKSALGHTTRPPPLGRLPVDVWLHVAYSFLPRTQFPTFRLVCRCLNHLLISRCAFWYARLSSSTSSLMGQHGGLLSEGDDSSSEGGDEPLQCTTTTARAPIASNAVSRASRVAAPRAPRPLKLRKCLVHKVVSRVEAGLLLPQALRDARCQRGCCHAAWRREHLVEAEIFHEQQCEDYEDAECAAILRTLTFPRLGRGAIIGAAHGGQGEEESHVRIHAATVLVITVVLILVLMVLAIVLVRNVNNVATNVSAEAAVYWHQVIVAAATPSASSIQRAASAYDAISAGDQKESVLASTLAPLWIMFPVYYALLLRLLWWSSLDTVLTALLHSISGQISLILVCVYAVNEWRFSFTTCVSPTIISAGWLFASSLLELKQQLQTQEGRAAHCRSATLMGLSVCRLSLCASILALALTLPQHLDEMFDDAQRLSPISSMRESTSPAPSPQGGSSSSASPTPQTVNGFVSSAFSLVSVSSSYRLALTAQNLFSSVPVAVFVVLACCSAIGIIGIALHRIGLQEVLEEVPAAVVSIGGCALSLLVLSAAAMTMCGESLAAAPNTTRSSSAVSLLSSPAIPQPPSSVGLTLVLCSLVVSGGMAACANACASYCQAIVPLHLRSFVAGRLFV